MDSKTMRNKIIWSDETKIEDCQNQEAASTTAIQE
jgi:hypothetical protein